MCAVGHARVAARQSGEDVVKRLGFRRVEQDGSSDWVASHDDEVFTQKVGSAAKVAVAGRRHDLDVVTLPSMPGPRDHRLLTSIEHREIGGGHGEARIGSYRGPESRDQTKPVAIVVLGDSVAPGPLECCGQFASMTLVGAGRLGTVGHVARVGLGPDLGLTFR
jgi:hypothetical protein